MHSSVPLCGVKSAQLQLTCTNAQTGNRRGKTSAPAPQRQLLSYQCNNLHTDWLLKVQIFFAASTSSLSNHQTKESNLQVCLRQPQSPSTPTTFGKCRKFFVVEFSCQHASFHLSTCLLKGNFLVATNFYRDTHRMS